MTTTEKTSHRGYRSLVGVAAITLLGLLVTAGVKSYRDLAAARGLEADLEERIRQSEARIRMLSDYVRMIEEDPLTLERLAREDLGMVRPGDVVVVLPEEPAEPPGERSPPAAERFPARASRSPGQSPDP